MLGNIPATLAEIFTIQTLARSIGSNNTQ